MTLAEIKAAVAGLMARATTADQQLRAEVTALNARLDGEVKTLTDHLTAATAENTKLQTALTEATAKYTKLDADFAAVNSKLAEVCGALKVEGADKLDATARVEALKNATNYAIAQTGVDLNALPGGSSAPAAGAPGNILAQYAAITNPMERVAFYRKNAEAMDDAHRKQLSN